jgi:hypothetical protein
MGWTPFGKRWAPTRAQSEALDNRTRREGETAQVYKPPPDSLIVFVSTPSGELRWVEVLEPEPTCLLAWDTGAR